MKVNFLEKFDQLKKSIPVPALHQEMNENCDYADYTYRSKNCYYCFECVRLENGFYCFQSGAAKNLFDCDYVYNSELCYDCLDSSYCYNCAYLQNCTRCRNCQYSFELLNCSDCFGCVELVNKQYCIFNKQYAKEEYELEIKKLKQLDQKEIFARVEELKKKIPHAASRQINTMNCPYGNFIYDSANCYWCFYVADIENSGYIFSCDLIKSSFDIYFAAGNTDEGSHMELCYEITDCGNCYGCAFLEWSENCTNCYCSFSLVNCSDCWGCVGLQNKKYCILNNQLTKEQYEKAVLDIKKELGWKVEP